MPAPTTLRGISATAASNSPADTDVIGSSAGGYLRSMQAVVRQYLANPATTVVASAGTADLSTSDGFWVPVKTSNASVTAAGTESAGIWYGVKFVDAAILIHNATSHILPGAATIVAAAGDSCLYESLGSGNWKIHAYQRIGGGPVGVSSFSDAPFNLTLACSVGSNALTIAIKTVAGADPSATDPVYVPFRSATAANGDVAILSLTAATSLVLSNGSTLGTTANVANRIWIVGFNDAGTFRLGAINCTTFSSGTLTQHPLAAWGIASSTAEGGAGAADSGQTFYTGTAVSSKAYRVLGYLTYESGLGTAGVYASAPTRVELFSAGTPLPGTTLQTARVHSVAAATGTTTIPDDDTIPQNTEGDQYLTKAITPSSAANILEMDALLHLSNSAASGQMTVAFFQDSTANAIASGRRRMETNLRIQQVLCTHMMVAGTTSATTINVRAGLDGVGTTTLNGENAARVHGGAMTSRFKIAEIVA